MKTKKSELLHSQTNVDTQDKEESNLTFEEITENYKVDETPFTLIKNKNKKWMITIANYIASEKEFKTKEDAIKEINKKTWELIVIASHIFTKLIEENKLNK